MTRRGRNVDKKKPEKTLSLRPIAEKIVGKMKQSTRRKLINIGSAIRGRAMAEELQKTITSREDLAKLHPAHATYGLHPKPGVGDVPAVDGIERDEAVC
jgi:hypothetical protein